VANPDRSRRHRGREHPQQAFALCAGPFCFHLHHRGSRSALVGRLNCLADATNRIKKEPRAVFIRASVANGQCLRCSTWVTT
jgi:hypothetical protein